MLTSKQLDLLRYIDMFIRESGGVAPSTSEMAEAMGLQSKSGIVRLLDGLQERGFIRRLANRARGVEVIRAPDGAPRNGRCPTCGQPMPHGPAPH